MTKATHAAIYARYSTDRQDPTSLEDQERLCRERADRMGLTVVAVYKDAATSGGVKVAQREGGRAMLADAMGGRFSVLIVEALDRLSRNLANNEEVVDRLEFVGVRIVSATDGYDTNLGESRFMLRGMTGMMNEHVKRTLPPKIRRGLAGQVARGFHAGGMSYGYRSVPVGMNARGEADGFRLEVVPEHAAVVREIFTLYANGWSTQRIAAHLNVRGIPGPGRKRTRPSTWSTSALYGTPKAGAGILNNELYIGRYVWGRRTWVRDPDNHKRRLPRMLPRDQWRIAERPELRIVDDETWNAVRERMSRPTALGGSRGHGRQPRTLFGGILGCGRCGGAMVAVSAREYGCAARKDRGESVCAGVKAPRRAADLRLIGELRAKVLAPEAVAQVRARVRELLEEASRSATAAAKARAARVAVLRGEIDRLTDAVAQLGLSAALRARLTAAEAELAALRVDPAPRAPATIDFDRIGREIQAVAMNLEAALSKDVATAREALARILGEVRIDERNGGIYAQMDIGPVLLGAVRADVTTLGCGGRI